jgi:hypothetical protein
MSFFFVSKVPATPGGHVRFANVGFDGRSHGDSGPLTASGLLTRAGSVAMMGGVAARATSVLRTGGSITGNRAALLGCALSLS